MIVIRMKAADMTYKELSETPDYIVRAKINFERIRNANVDFVRESRRG